MGQCASRKASDAFASSSKTTYSAARMHKYTNTEKSPDCDYKDNANPIRKPGVYTKGVAMSFGFKRRPATAPSIADNATAARRLAKHEVIDRNGNGADTEPLTSNAIPPGRTTPRLAPPRKEAGATRVSRFGFRQPNANRLNRATDINVPPTQLEYKNNNKPTFRAAAQPKAKPAVAAVDANENRTRFGYVPPQASRYTLQSSHLPKPQLPVRVIETKTAKTLANNNRKASRGMHQTEDTSSKEGSVTEDSGVGSHSSTGNAETDTLRGVDLLDSSPTTGSHQSWQQQKPKQFEMVLSGQNFDLRDVDDYSEPIVPLPSLPSAFENNKYNNGFVRERRLEYEKQLEKSRRKISLTSSEGFSDDYVDNEKTAQNNRFSGNDTSLPPKIFLKSKAKLDSSPPSSDEQEWMHAGEAMADDFSCSFSSSDESKDRESLVTSKLTVKPASLALQNLMNASSIPICTLPNQEIKNVLLTIEDPKFAAVASNTGALLEDETSPVDSLICSYSESDDFMKLKLLNNDIKKNALMTSSSDSKDINEKLTLSPSSPGTPTNASNSLSLSDGKDYFDDEIADQPALVFDDTLTASEAVSIAQQNSENTPTIIDDTPKPKRKPFQAFEGSPLLLRKKNLLHSRTASVDTLSPCESITSDDLMLDYEQSQSSGIDDTLLDRNDRRQSNGFHSLDSTTLVMEENKVDDMLLREWAMSAGNQSNKDSPRCMARSTRLLRSRASTPSSVPDSPCSLDSRMNSKPSHSVTRSPMRPPRPSLASPVSYDSDDSIKIDRASHGAIVQDIVQIKTNLIKLKRVLNEQADEDYLKKSETLNPFDNQPSLRNGLFNGLSSEGASTENLSMDDNSNSKMRIEMADLRRQVLFLQGQLEDREQAMQNLKEKMDKLVVDNEVAKSAPASTVASEVLTANAATQTERMRPISAGPSMLHVSPTEGSVGSLVSASESSRRSRPPSLVECSSSQLNNNSNSGSRKAPPKLWRQPGEPPSPQWYGSNNSSSFTPRRASRSPISLN